ncbi:ring-1,2-phenylacetyl-CoA epoxidase subunit PaaC [Murinocardiopsis flavida]|uniref:Ring-1,2-phenylacetyl-CoA epoxidase subunit PaaC n=1 Tax=Murinocardiopsis flavida TaxID=645275 RepID=A0A2P8DMV0_9ACTN|nr:1,2-phenylacetyl-CoA epoxidase subunit PaaC [Murinocardiopsis flavida]PSK98543.1 ring-1,2-phenylacetyl-CoA epoxidase subunit PaaC [Murinocardiopsis flavida]
MTTGTGPGTDAATAGYLLRLGDDALIAGHRMAEVVTRAPQLEEDVALANIALDLLGQARPLLTRAGELEGEGRDEDTLAYLRDEPEFRNCLLVELPNTDFAHTIARHLLFSCYARELYAALAASTDDVLAGVAGKAVKELDYHRDHAAQWTVRLGDGTEESAARMAAALDAAWPHVDEMFTADPVISAAAASGAGVDPAGLRPAWDSAVDAVLAEAGLHRPDLPPQAGPGGRGGRHGLHTQSFGFLLAEMQHVHRSHPGAAW